jgi:AraC-like DNA-binding protein
MSGRHSFSRYLPIERDALLWGLHVIDCGITDIAAGEAYPKDVSHPIEYVCEWKDGRRLSEFQIVYITRGTGIFDSQKIKNRQVIAGDVLLVFPGEWHRYRCNDETGWDECWVGFNGKYAEQLMHAFFKKTERILHVGFDLPLYQAIRSMPDIMESSLPGFQQILAAKTTEVIAYLHSLALRGGREARLEKVIQDIRMQLIAEINQTIDFRAVAGSLGMSYPKFCAFFKDRTGLPPHQYAINMRINRAQELLAHTRQRISEISEILGFESPYYFSRIFKSKLGRSPSEYREEQSGCEDTEN